MATKPGISEHSTRPSRRAAREQSTGLGSMLSNSKEENAAPEASTDSAVSSSGSSRERTDAPGERVAAEHRQSDLAVAASRLSAAKKVRKVPFSTQIEMDTEKRVEWLIRTKGYKKTDITGDALDALLDAFGVPPADKIKD